MSEPSKVETDDDQELSMKQRIAEYNEILAKAYLNADEYGIYRPEDAEELKRARRRIYNG